MMRPSHIVCVVFLSLGVNSVMGNGATHRPRGAARRSRADGLHSHQKYWPAPCQNGVRQSPIAITSHAFPQRIGTTITANLSNNRYEAVDVGHTLQVKFLKPTASFDFDGRNYLLKGFHFHKPAEHVLDGKRYDMEAHFVFTTFSDDIFVLAILMGQGDENRELEKIWQELPLTDTLQGEDLDLEKIIPHRLNLLTYEGSLTTPPCSENVTHAIAMNAIEISREQLDRFAISYPPNNRRLQPVGNAYQRKFRREIMVLGN